MEYNNSVIETFVKSAYSKILRAALAAATILPGSANAATENIWGDGIMKGRYARAFIREVGNLEAVAQAITQQDAKIIIPILLKEPRYQSVKESDTKGGIRKEIHDKELLKHKSFAFDPSDHSESLEVRVEKKGDTVILVVEKGRGYHSDVESLAAGNKTPSYDIPGTKIVYKFTGPAANAVIERVNGKNGVRGVDTPEFWAEKAQDLEKREKSGGLSDEDRALLTEIRDGLRHQPVPAAGGQTAQAPAPTEIPTPPATLPPPIVPGGYAQMPQTSSDDDGTHPETGEVGGSTPSTPQANSNRTRVEAILRRGNGRSPDSHPPAQGTTGASGTGNGTGYTPSNDLEELKAKAEQYIAAFNKNIGKANRDSKAKESAEKAAEEFTKLTLEILVDAKGEPVLVGGKAVQKYNDTPEEQKWVSEKSTDMAKRLEAIKPVEVQVCSRPHKVNRNFFHTGDQWEHANWIEYLNPFNEGNHPLLRLADAYGWFKLLEKAFEKDPEVVTRVVTVTNNVPGPRVFVPVPVPGPAAFPGQPSIPGFTGDGNVAGDSMRSSNPAFYDKAGTP